MAAIEPTRVMHGKIILTRNGGKTGRISNDKNKKKTDEKAVTMQEQTFER
jgi:hypothetical protein